MYRIFVILLIVTSFSFTTNGQDRDIEVLRGKVKFITCFEYEAAEKPGEVPRDQLTTKTTFLYNEKGNLIETNHFDIKNNIVFSKEKSVYDNNGNMVEITFYNKAGEVDAKYIYKYDNKNHEIEKDTYWKGRFDGKVITTYDYKKSLVKVDSYKADETLEMTFSYKIDDKGNHVEDYNSEGELTSRTTIQYDNKGRIIKENWEAWEEDNEKGIVKHEYDEWNNEIKHINMSIDGKTIISYNKTEYVYDKLGNWIKSVETYSYNKIRKTTKRDIEYY